MKYTTINAVLFLLIFFTSCSQNTLPILEEQKNIVQTNAWEISKNYPPKDGRNDDVSFVDLNIGWAINGNGNLYKTIDAGKSWENQFTKEGSYFRALAFKDTLNGWLGTIGTGLEYYNEVTDTVTLYQTSNGGESWQPATIKGPYPTGICGLQVVNDNFIVGSGRVGGPSYFIKSTDGGKTWHSKDMSDRAGLLITPYFFNDKKGILIGGTNDQYSTNDSQALILKTEDGGINWDTVYVSEQKSEWCWKASFVSDKIGFVSVQRNVKDGRFYLLKTSDGGNTWEEIEFTKKNYFVQGIGFLNENVGWLGGDWNYSYETRDGGKSWAKINIGAGLNKFTFIDNNTAYASGATIYKLNTSKNIPDGQVKSIYNNGNLKKISTFTSGILNGPESTYYSNGKIKSKGSYKNNLKNGKWKYYNESGNEDIWRFDNGMAKIPLSKLRKFEGIYENKKKEYTYIFVKGGQLFLRWSGGKYKTKLYANDINKFFIDNYYNYTMDFQVNETDQVNGLIYNSREIGVIYEAKKLSKSEAAKVIKEMDISE